jgi:hypothetical protein
MTHAPQQTTGIGQLSRSPRRRDRHLPPGGPTVHRQATCQQLTRAHTYLWGIRCRDRSSGGEPQVTEQNDVTKLYEEFEEAFVDVLTAKSEGVSFSRRMKLRLARSRLRAHKDFTQREYDAAVLRADARAWKILG